MNIFNIFSQCSLLFALFFSNQVVYQEQEAEEIITEQVSEETIAEEPMAEPIVIEQAMEEPEVEESTIEEVTVAEEVVVVEEAVMTEETATTEDAVVEESIEEEVIGATENVESEVLTPMEVMSDSSKKTYMSYEAITDETSSQYQYIHNSGEITINEDGFLVTDDGYIGVALGSYFGEIGTKYQFVLDTGVTLKVVKVEEKSDEHTDESGFYQKYDGSVIEFVIDIDKIENSEYAECLTTGDFNSHEDFNGNIVEIYKVE